MTVLMKDVIEHYGVKGMRWGVRKDRRKSDEVKKLDPFKRADKDPDDMTTAELKKLVEDMRLRQQYNQMATSESAKSGKSWTTSMLDRVATTTIQIATNQIATMAVKSAIDSYMARSAARSVVRPLPPPIPGTRKG